MLYSITDLPTVTSNMISKVKHVGESDSSNSDFSLGHKEVFIETNGVYQRTQIKKGVAITLDYKWLARESDEEDRQPAIMSTYSSNSIKDLEAIWRIWLISQMNSQREQKIKNSDQTTTRVDWGDELSFDWIVSLPPRKFNPSHPHSINRKESNIWTKMKKK